MRKVERNQWLRLYQLADKIKALKAWEWMGIQDCFGVMTNEMHEPCTVLFCNSESSGFDIRFMIGWKSFYDMVIHLAKPALQEPSFLLELRFVNLLFLESAQMGEHEQAVLDAIGRKPDAEGKSPVFRSFIPGYHPWQPDSHERDLLEDAMYQTLGMVLRVESNGDLLKPRFPHELLIREKRESGEWHDRWVRVKNPVNEEVEVSVEKRRIYALRGKPLLPITVQMDLILTSLAVQTLKNKRPQTTYVLLLVDVSSGKIYSGELMHATEGVPQMWGHIPERLLSIFEQMNGCPSTIELRSDRMANLMRPLSELLSFKMVRRERLSVLEYVAEGLNASLKGKEDDVLEEPPSDSPAKDVTATNSECDA